MDDILSRDSDNSSSIDCDFISENGFQNDLEEENSSCSETDVPLDIRWDNFEKNFVWTKEGNFNPIIHEFTDLNAGIQSDANVNSQSSVLDVFQLFFTDECIDMITAMTNIHQEQLKSNELNTVKAKARIWKWTPLTSEELYTFFALRILMGIIKKPKLEMYWSTNPLLDTPIFREHISLRRFQSIQRYIYFSVHNESDDKIRKVRPFFEYLVQRFQKAYRPGPNISIDETLLKFQGRLSFKQCNLQKRARFGIKLYKCCDSLNGYIYNASIYMGKEKKESINKFIGVSGKVVNHMLSDLRGQGRTIYIDNWYSSPTLFSELHRKKNNVCGTVRKNRKYMPVVTDTELKRMKRGEIKTFHSTTMCVIYWKDKKVIMLDTVDTPNLVECQKIDRLTGVKVKKPMAAVRYNKFMGGVDRSDQIIQPYEIPRKSSRWYQKVAFHMLDLALHNANIIYNILNSENKLTHCDFRIRVVTELLEKYGQQKERSTLPPAEPTFKKRIHFPSLIKTSSNSPYIRKRCIKCSENNKRTDTRTWCIKCGNIPLCMSCFGEYHM